MAWFSIGFLLFLIGMGAFLWFDRTYVTNKVLDSFIQKIAPSLPFKIESYRLGRNLDFFELHLIWNEVPVSIEGPLKVEWLGKEGLSIEYHPAVRAGDSTPLNVNLSSEISTRLQVADGVRIKIPSQSFSSKLLGVDIKGLIAAIDLDKGVGTLDLGMKSLAWTDSKNSNHAINADTLRLQAKLPDIHDSMKGDALFTIKSTEILWDKFYSDLNLQALPLQVLALSRESVKVLLGKKGELNLDVQSKWNPGNELDESDIKWKIASLDLKRIAPWVLKTFSSSVPALQAYSDLEVKAGSLRGQGEVRYQARLKRTVLRSMNITGDHVSLRSLSHQLATRELKFNFPYRESDPMHRADLEAQVVYYKHFQATLKRTEIKWNERSFSTTGPLPLVLKDIPLQIGKIEGEMKPELRVTSSLQIQKMPLAPLLDALCMPSAKFPPATLDVNFSSLEYSPGVIDPTGKLNVSFFKGMIELNDIGFYDLDTEVPEIIFDAEWKGIDMQMMGEWSKFGEIKGTLEGYAHEVVFQSFLPTHYYFLVQVKPLNPNNPRDEVEFSPEAMKNVVKVFTGASLDEQIPGVARWLMFGWPSRVFGGYDVSYAGIKLTSEEGRILVETLDPPGIFAKERKHFVLYGRRFKMPLRNPNYPLLIDATSMSNFVHQLMTQLGSIKKQKEGSLENEDAPIQCDPPEL